MTKKKFAVLGLASAVAAWILVNALLDFHAGRPEAVNPQMQLAPYREGMSLREVFETFPQSGDGSARVRILEDNNVAWAARWELLKSARHNIELSYFILKQDVFGVALLGLLLNKAKEGVKVRVLLDAYGSKLSWHPEGNDYLDALVNTGNVEVRMYRPLLDRVTEGLLNLSLAVVVASEHDKILVVDGESAITGGRNIATEYFAHPDDADTVFSDLELEIADRGIASALRTAFETQYNSDAAEVVGGEALDLRSQERALAWAYQAMDLWLHDARGSARLDEEIQQQRAGWAEELARLKQLRGYLRQPLPPYSTHEVRLLDSTTRFNSANDVISLAAARLIKSARKEIFIQNPYVVVSDEAMDIFAEASRNEVPIILLTNSPASADSVVSQAFFLEQWRYLLARIPTLHLFGNAEEQMIHTKMATFDNTLSLVGTYNLSPLSMATNSEVVLAVWSPDFAARVTAKPRAMLAAGAPQVFRYRIARHPDGSPQYDDNGKPIAAFGPEDHTELEDNAKLQAVWKALKAVDRLPGVSPFF